MSYEIKEESPSRHKRTRALENVLIMQGGGSLGSFACGVFKGLVKQKIKIDICYKYHYIFYMSKNHNSISMNFTPFTQLISDFKGKNIPDEQIKADYNNTLNYPNNYFVAPDSWHECFYTTSKKNMLLLSQGLENILHIKPPFNKFILVSLFQRKSNFNSVAEQYATISPLSKKTYLIGGKGLAQGVNLSNVEIIDFTGSGLEKNWVVIAIAKDEGCALIAEEIKSDRYRGFFTTNRNLTNRCLNIIRESLNIEIEI